jgi:hypothetical protein
MMAKQKVEPEAAEGASVTVAKPKAGKGGKVRHISIDIAEDGYVVMIDRESSKIGPYVEPEKRVAKTLDDLDAILDGALGIKD